MNYLSQLLAFRDYQLFETKLSSGQIALWHALMQINNKCAWIEWFTTTNQMLETLSGLSRSGINKNRNVLKQLGLIDFRSNGKKATSYKVFKLYTSDSTQESVQDNIHTSDSAQRSTQQGVQGSVQQGGTLTKQNTNTNKIKDSNSVPNESEAIPYAGIIDYLNKATGKSFRNVETNKKLIRARWHEGNRLDNFKKVIDIKVIDAGNPDSYFDGKYLQPSTLFGNKFDQYLNQPVTNKTQKTGGESYAGVVF